MNSPAAQPQQERFDLSRFVLDFLEKEGSVVTPPSFGIHEALLPEDLAASLQIDDFVHLSFDPEQPATPDGPLRLSVNHPLVETMAERVAAQPANATAYINGVRLQKTGLLDLARKQFGFPNARLDGVPKMQEERELHHYVQFNFKITTITEEKQESQATVIMDLQSGHAVTDPDQLRLLAVLDPQPAFDTLLSAPPRWTAAGDALADETLQALLPRAESVLRAQMAERLDGVATRIQHNLELDLARIEEYYDGLAGDMRRRRTRLAEDETDRIQALDDKLTALDAERRKKLDDVRGRYVLRVEIELINVLIMVQPKVTLPATIGNRTATIQRTVVWDPLFHHLEPLVCDVCGQPGEGMTLCTGGHLAHEDCLAPQCIDCKRAFCRLCGDQIQECIVCHQPVCRPSLIKCPTCGRGTCQAHQNLCHAAEGEPAVLVTEAPAPTPSKSPAPSPKPPSPRPSKGPPISTKNSDGKDKSSAKAPAIKTPPPAPTATGVRIVVDIYETEPTIVAFVLRSKERVLATRAFRLMTEGIAVQCTCEKSPCAADGFVFRPWPLAEIPQQIEDFLKKLRLEYGVPAKKVDLYYKRHQEIRKLEKLVLPAYWHDPERIATAIRGFDAMQG
ncbi:MAG: hypothetical protein KBG20_02460 [Caldilineaceae bacterium]|nr:hypothetical protein [Caldilineaceae bacterium]MBP8106318.1 hypothetical protein [Caldilineaceae bacterium]MBP9071126.1 hypothetical protein [Caldilineaceae bacterium]